MSSNNRQILKTYFDESDFLVPRPKSSQNRLILPFLSRHWFAHGIGLKDTSLPKELKDLEINEYEWDNMIQKLQRDVQPFAPSNCSLFFYWTFTIAGMFCCLWQKEGRYQKKLENWLEELNSQVLLKKNLYAKIQSNEMQTKNYNETFSWLAISLNFEDAQILRNEPVLWAPNCCNSEIEPIFEFCTNLICCFGPKRVI